MSKVKVNNIFITGANRGIGLGLVKSMLTQFQPTHLFATYRDAHNSKELLDLAAQNANLHAIELDVTDYAKLPGVVKEVDTITGGTGVNLLINNSGILSRQFKGIRDVTRDDLVQHVEINTIAPVMISQAFVPLLEKAAAKNSDKDGIQRAVLFNVSTTLASIADNTGNWISYRVSKTALNMATKCASIDLKDSGVTTIMLHPGWVQTDMGTRAAQLTVDESVAAIINTLKGVTSKTNGKFLSYDGTELPW